MEALYNYIRRFGAFSHQEFEQVTRLLELKHCKKKEILTQLGQVEQYLYIVGSGMVRKFFYKGRQEVITQLAREGEMVCASVSFLSGQPSQYVVEAIEPSTLFALSTASLERIYAMGHRMERLGRLITLDWVLQKEIWEYNRIQYAPKERFIRFMKENSDMVQRVPQKYLASYLNIKPETFSRYKHLLKK